MGGNMAPDSGLMLYDCLFRLPVPNMIADLDQAPKERVDKPVWRVAFFGRLEERKGIKLFVDAVQVCKLSHCGTAAYQIVQADIIVKMIPAMISAVGLRENK